MSQRLWGVFGLLLISSPSVMATTFLVMSEEDKMRAATSICAVEVKDVKSEKVQEGIRTRATVQLVKHDGLTVPCFKGNESETFDVIWPGGVINTVDSNGKPAQEITKVIGTPDLRKNQTAVLYLWKKNPNDLLTVLSWVNGITPIKYDSTAREYRLEMRVRSGEPKGTSRSGAREPASTAARAATPNEAPKLSDFRNRVQNVLSQPPSAQRR